MHLIVIRGLKKQRNCLRWIFVTKFNAFLVVPKAQALCFSVLSPFDLATRLNRKGQEVYLKVWGSRVDYQVRRPMY